MTVHIAIFVMVTVTSLFLGRFIGELVAYDNQTFLDHFGRVELKRSAKRFEFTRKLLDCALCVGFWVRIPWAVWVAIELVDDGLASILIIVSGLLAAYETDRLWQYRERMLGKLTEEGRSL